MRVLNKPLPAKKHVFHALDHLNIDAAGFSSIAARYPVSTTMVWPACRSYSTKEPLISKNAMPLPEKRCIIKPSPPKIRCPTSSGKIFISTPASVAKRRTSAPQWRAGEKFQWAEPAQACWKQKRSSLRPDAPYKYSGTETHRKKPGQTVFQSASGIGVHLHIRRHPRHAVALTMHGFILRQPADHRRERGSYNFVLHHVHSFSAACKRICTFGQKPV